MQGLMPSGEDKSCLLCGDWEALIAGPGSAEAAWRAAALRICPGAPRRASRGRAASARPQKDLWQLQPQLRGRLWSYCAGVAGCHAEGACRYQPAGVHAGQRLVLMDAGQAKQLLMHKRY